MLVYDFFSFGGKNWRFWFENLFSMRNFHPNVKQRELFCCYYSRHAFIHSTRESRGENLEQKHRTFSQRVEWKMEKVFQGKTDEGLLLLIGATGKQMLTGWDSYWFTVQIILNGFPLLNKYIKLWSKQNIVVWFVCRESSNRAATPSMTQLGSQDQESILSFPWTVDCCFHPLPCDILRPLVLFVTHGPSRQNFPFLLTTKFSYGQSIMKASINLLKRWCLSFLPGIQYNILKRSK